jgi:acetyl esterase/lipase
MIIERIKKYTIPLAELSTIPGRVRDMYWREPVVSVQHRVAFGADRRQYLLYFEPPAHIPRKDKWLMFYHGGGWYLGRPAMFPQVIDFFVNLGYPVVLPAYRLCPKYNFTHMREDLNGALKTTLRLMEETTEGPQKIVIGGMSAGANLAAHLVFNTEILKEMEVDYPFAGFLSCGGPLDLNFLPDTFIVRTFTGGKYGSQAFRQANPVELLSSDSPVLPALFISGTNDTIVPPRANYSFYQKYASVAPAVWHELPDQQHLDAIRWIHDDNDTASKIRDWLETVDSRQWTVDSGR